MTNMTIAARVTLVVDITVNEYVSTLPASTDEVYRSVARNFFERGWMAARDGVKAPPLDDPFTCEHYAAGHAEASRLMVMYLS